MAIASEIVNLRRIFALYESVATLDLAAPPTARLILPTRTVLPRRVGVLCGSFNPLTLAHTELATGAAAAFSLDTIFFSLAKVTVDKEQVTGMSLEDRLLLLSCVAQRYATMEVALVNRGLYFEQAQAFRALLGKDVTLSFVIGMDKLLQIFDPRYYQDREAALEQLFAMTSLLVANRGAMDEESFTRLLSRPENRSFRSHVQFFTLPPAVMDHSATTVRRAVAAGQRMDSHVLPETTAFITETRAFAPPLQVGTEMVDAYAVRTALLAILYQARSWAEREVDFRSLMSLALASNETGRTLRRLTEEAEGIARLQATLKAERE